MGEDGEAKGTVVCCSFVLGGLGGGLGLMEAGDVGDAADVGDGTVGPTDCLGRLCGEAGDFASCGCLDSWVGDVTVAGALLAGGLGRWPAACVV